jgi:very-short-patch-repair endonuclease
MEARKRRIPKELTQRARALRREATRQERVLWNLLSRFRPKFTRQLSLPPFVADFACRQARLLVELDGSQHIGSSSDLARTRRLVRNGWTVLRFWNSEVDENPDGVAEAILLQAAECLGGTHPQPSLPGRGVPATPAATTTPLPGREGPGVGRRASAILRGEATRPCAETVSTHESLL